MISDAKLAANRRNAQRGTGPRTLEGKRESSRNALKHGLTAETVVIRGESGEQYSEFRVELIKDLAPVGPLEETIACRLVDLYWRYRRATGAEAVLFNDAGSQLVTPFQSTPQAMANFTRHESSLLRQIQTLQKELERLQSRRRSETVAAPGAVARPGSVEAVASSPVRPRKAANDQRKPTKDPATGDLFSIKPKPRAVPPNSPAPFPSVPEGSVGEAVPQKTRGEGVT